MKPSPSTSKPSGGKCSRRPPESAGGAPRVPIAGKHLRMPRFELFSVILTFFTCPLRSISNRSRRVPIVISRASAPHTCTSAIQLNLPRSFGNARAGCLMHSRAEIPRLVMLPEMWVRSFKPPIRRLRLGCCTRRLDRSSWAFESIGQIAPQR